MTPKEVYCPTEEQMRPYICAALTGLLSGGDYENSPQLTNKELNDLCIQAICIAEQTIINIYYDREDLLDQKPQQD